MNNNNNQNLNYLSPVFKNFVKKFLDDSNKINKSEIDGEVDRGINSFNQSINSNNKRILNSDISLIDSNIMKNNKKKGK
jgi:hypothetical protein